MLHFKMQSGHVVEVSKECPAYDDRNNWLSRHDFKTFFEAETICTAANLNTTGKRYIATDAGAWCSPQFDVIEMPVVGEKVSYAFNGDSRPDGVITKITESLRVITTSTGNKYYRKKLTGSWKLRKTWSMISGHHNERNTSF